MSFQGLKFIRVHLSPRKLAITCLFHIQFQNRYYQRNLRIFPSVMISLRVSTNQKLAVCPIKKVHHMQVHTFIYSCTSRAQVNTNIDSMTFVDEIFMFIKL